MDVKNAVDAGCRIVQYREKNKNKENMVKEAKQIKKICRNNSLFLINNYVDIALIVNADGVHLGQDDISVLEARKILGKNKIIGLTVHNLKEAIGAKKQGADYIALAPIYKTDTKEDSKSPCGPKMISKIKENVDLPLIAVGGINKNNLKEVIRRGADGVVAVSSVITSDDVFSEIKDYIRIIKEEKSK
jgi:thiamine-phosphate pyrophosphorylase